jgi:hypothetical protein
MFGLCRDQFSKEISRRGFGLVALPDASLRPLQVLGRMGRSLTRYGDVKDIFVSSETDLPEVKSETNVAPINVTQTSWLDGKIGLRVLTRWLGDQSAGIAGKIGSSANFRLEVQGITKKEIDLAKLDKFLVKAHLSDDVPTIEQLLEADRLYITTAVLSSKSLVLRYTKESGVGAELAQPVTIARTEVGGEVSIQSKGSTEVIVVAERPVAFAYRAVRIMFRDGVYVTFARDRKEYILRGEEDDFSEGAETGWLSDEIGGDFLRLEDPR